MADRVLRDECDHGRYEEHWWEHGENLDGSIARYHCPGGREVPIDQLIVYVLPSREKERQ